MPRALWGEAFRFVLEVLNISATNAIDGATPFFRRFGSRPDVSSLRTWACVVFVFTPKVLRKNKLENPGKPGELPSVKHGDYAQHSESYRVLSMVTGDIQEVRSVECFED
ncbi:hypothetical protein PHYSODRAFT_410807, partial [Phytophthora sojae]